MPKPKPFIFDQCMNRDSLLADTRRVVAAFCLLNKIETPPVVDSPYLRNFGEWSQAKHTIYVNAAQCKFPSPTQFHWSFPGHKSDRTVMGVACHELGHCCHFQAIRRSPKRAMIRPAWRTVTQHEAKVTSYEDGYGEGVAEALRIFILNPHLLALGRPQRYEFMTDVLDLRPLHMMDWQEVLANAPDKIHKAARLFIDIRG